MPSSVFYKKNKRSRVVYLMKAFICGLSYQDLDLIAKKIIDVESAMLYKIVLVFNQFF